MRENREKRTKRAFWRLWGRLGTSKVLIFATVRRFWEVPELRVTSRNTESPKIGGVGPRYKSTTWGLRGSEAKKRSAQGLTRRRVGEFCVVPCLSPVCFCIIVVFALILFMLNSVFLHMYSFLTICFTHFVF